MDGNKSGISYKVVLYLSAWLFSLAFLFTFIFASFYQSKQFIDEKLTLVQKVTQGHMSSIISHAIEQYEEEIIDSALTPFLLYDYLHSIIVYDANNKILSHLEDVNAVIDEMRLYPVEMKIYEGGVQPDADTAIPSIGRVTFYYVINPVSDGMQALFLKAIVYSLLLSLIIMLVIHLVVRYLDAKITGFLKAMKKLSKGHENIRFDEDSKIIEVRGFATYFNQIAHDIELSRENIKYEKEVLEIKNNVLQVAAHELRTPISNMKTFLDIAITHNLNDRKKEVLDTLKKCFSDMYSLDKHITAILALSALKNRALTRSDTWVHISTIFDELERQYSVKCNSKQSLSWGCYNVAKKDWQLYLDRDLVTIIISNAIDNAVKYTNKGFVRVSYDVKDDKLLVTIHDSGVGLTEKELEKLAKHPGQLDNRIKRGADGWGIGMATMYRFADFLEGEIQIESNKNFGTKVEISIPVKVKSQKDMLVEELETITNTVEPISPILGNSSTYVHNFVEGGFQVLVIDNDSQYLSQMEELLSPSFLHRDDVQVTFCSSPSDAIRAIEEYKFDLIFVDYHMPGMDGLQFLEFLKYEDNMCKSASVIIITADAAIPPGVKSDMDRMANKVMSKGVTSAEIRDIIRVTSLKSVG